jgi:carbamate kinase
MDLPECTAMSQGYIGYHLQQEVAKELRRVGAVALLALGAMIASRETASASLKDS